MHRTRFPFLLLALLILPALAAQASTYVVYPDGSGDAPTIQAAVQAARGGDEILLGDGVFSGEGNWNVDLMGKAITLRSVSGEPSRTVIDVQGVHDNFVVERAFYIVSGEGPETVLRDFTITGGDADGACPDCQGGAVWIDSSSPTLINLTFRDNYGVNGGALFVQGENASPVIRDSRFLNNTALTGGAVEVFEGASASFTGCLFRGNVAEQYGIAGAIRVFNNDASLHLDRCTIVQNSAPFGSAFEFYSCNVLIENSIIADNLGSQAVGITEQSDILIRYSLIHGNPGTNWPKEISLFRTRLGNLDLPVNWAADPAQGGLGWLDLDSPAVDAGDPNAPLDPDGTRADMGARYFDQQGLDGFAARHQDRRSDPGSLTDTRHANSRTHRAASDGSTAQTPDRFTLSPAYPNPFNGQTRVRITLPEAGDLRVRVLTVQGREVAELAAGLHAAGTHDLAWSASSGMASGVYLMVADAGRFGVRSSKLVLVK